MRLDKKINIDYNISRTMAQELIKKGFVLVDGMQILKTNYECDENSVVTVEQTQKFVSKGGYKLEKAICEFNLDLHNKVCLDIGASTGGFTDCMLSYGASKIYAVDVGTNQLHESLRNNKKVLSFEQINIKDFKVEEKFDFVAVDVSFTSVAKILEPLNGFIAENTQAIILLKPQFEAESKLNIKNGIQKNKNQHLKYILNLSNTCKEFSLCCNDIVKAPNEPNFNQEYLILISRFESGRGFLIKSKRIINEI